MMEMVDTNTDHDNEHDKQMSKLKVNLGNERNNHQL